MLARARGGAAERRDGGGSAMDHPPLADRVGQSSDMTNVASAVPVADARPNRAIPFVGREAELTVLRGYWAEAVAGRGRLALVAGEPGIGKTRLTGELAAHAGRHGAAVLHGSAPDGDWAPPFAPWSEALAGYSRAVPAERLRSEIGPGAAALSRLVPALRDALAAVVEAAAIDPEADRARLFDAVSQFLINVAVGRPVLVILDDLHWADQATLALVRHVARTTAGARILVVGTYRDATADVGRDHPLSDLVTELHRAGQPPLRLKGLPEDATRTLFAATVGTAVAPAVMASAIEDSGGNPFIVVEIGRQLRDEGSLAVAPDVGDGPTGSIERGVPDGVRLLVERRQARFSAATRDLLRKAAVFSGGFDYAVLQDLTGFEDDVLLDALDEALAAGILRPVDGRQERYGFAQSIVRQVLLADWNPSRRVRLHRQAAEALARVLGERAADHAAELAAQFFASASLPGANAGVLHAVVAAERARATADPDRAVAYLRMARELARDEPPERRAQLLTELAIVEAEALRFEAARRSSDDAVSALTAAGVGATAIAADLGRIAFAMKTGNAAEALWRPLMARGLRLLEGAGTETADETRDLIWARLMLLDDPIESIGDGRSRASRWLGFDPRAVAIARTLGDEDDYARSVESFDARTLAETRELLARTRTWSQPRAVLRGLSVVANDLQYRHGSFREAETLWEELVELAERHGAISWQATGVHQLTFLQTTLGDFARARDMEARAKTLLDRLGPYREAEVLEVEMATAFATYLDGDWAEIGAFWTRFVGSAVTSAGGMSPLAGLLYGAMAAFAHARAGAETEARRLLDWLTPTLTRVPVTMGNHNGAVGFAASAVWDLGATEFAPVYRRLVLDLMAAEIGDYPQTSLALSLARMTSLLDSTADQTALYAAARSATERDGQRPLRAIVDHDEGVARVRATIGGAGDLFATAANAFDGLGMAGWAARARLAGEAAIEGATSARERRAFGLTDREADVLRLIARGYPDRQVADDLFISTRTVHAHLRNMFTKVGVANRTELSVWAVEQGIVQRIGPRPDG